MKIDYNEWKEQKCERWERQVRAESDRPGRLPGRRPRDPEKERLLTEMLKARWQQLIDSGKLEVVGPRKYKWHTEKIGEKR